MPTPFYTQQLDMAGLRVEASASVSPFALAEAAWLARHVLRPTDAQTLAANGVRLVVIGTSEMVTDLPEYSGLVPAIWWDRRYRGMGPTPDIPVILCPEEDLLRLAEENADTNTSVCMHELAHAVDTAHALRGDDLGVEMQAAYEAAKAAATWPDSYDMESAGEYFAAGAMVWFGRPTPAAVAMGVSSRGALRKHDAPLARLCEKALGQGAWQYAEPEARRPPDRRHLRGFRPGSVAPFSWPERARWEAPEIRLPWASSSPPSSPASGNAGWLILANHRHEPVDIAWLDFEGQAKPWFTLRSGEERLQDVYAGHVWIVSGSQGELGRVIASEGTRYLEITSRQLPPDNAALRERLRGGTATLMSPGVPGVSPASDDLAWILFVNHRADPVELEWIDFDGNPQPMDSVPAGGELLRDAYVGHVWRILTGETVLGTFTVGPTDTRIDVR